MAVTSLIKSSESVCVCVCGGERDGGKEGERKGNDYVCTLWVCEGKCVCVCMV